MALSLFESAPPLGNRILFQRQLRIPKQISSFGSFHKLPLFDHRLKYCIHFWNGVRCEREFQSAKVQPNQQHLIADAWAKRFPLIGCFKFLWWLHRNRCNRFSYKCCLKLSFTEKAKIVARKIKLADHLKISSKSAVNWGKGYIFNFNTY